MRHCTCAHKQKRWHFHAKTTVHWRSTHGAGHFPLCGIFYIFISINSLGFLVTPHRHAKRFFVSALGRDDFQKNSQIFLGIWLTSSVMLRWTMASIKNLEKKEKVQHTSSLLFEIIIFKNWNLMRYFTFKISRFICWRTSRPTEDDQLLGFMSTRLRQVPAMASQAVPM